MTPDQVCPLYRELLKGSPITFLEDQVTQIDLLEKKVYLASDIHYDYDTLVLVLGRKAGFFKVEGAQDYAFPFKTKEDAETLRQHLQKCLKKASQTEDETTRKTLLTFAIVGGGPTGIEMAGTLGDLLANWYQEVSYDNIRLDFVTVAVKKIKNFSSCVVIEAKHPRENLDHHVRRLGHYLMKTKSFYGVLTNGKEFRIYQQ